MSIADPVPYDRDALTFFGAFLESMHEFEEESYGNAVDSDLLRRIITYLRCIRYLNMDSLMMLKDPLQLHRAHPNHPHTPVVLAIAMFREWTYNNCEESIWRTVLRILLDISNIMFGSDQYRRHYVYSDEDNEMLNTLRDDILNMPPLRRLSPSSREHDKCIFGLLNPVRYLVLNEEEDNIPVETRYFRWIEDEQMGEIDY
jgi:hypothetical protein